MHPLAQRCRGLPHNGSRSALRAATGQWSGRNSLNHRLHPLPLLPLRLARYKYYYGGNATTRPPPPAFQRQSVDTPPKTQTKPYEAKAVVIGGGPAGMAAVANLLEAIPDGEVVWVDKTFQGGTTWLWETSQGYSSADEFKRFAYNNDVFAHICAGQNRKAIETLEKLDGKRTCSLKYAVDMLKFLSDGLLRHERVHAVNGTADCTARDPETLKWTVKVRPPSMPGHDRRAVGHYRAPMVVLCTGTRPREVPLLPPLLPPPGQERRELPRPAAVSLGLDSTQLGRRLHVWIRGWVEQHPDSTQPMTVAVIGDGHSAVLTLKNLVAAALALNGRLRVRWFTREANLKYTKLAPVEEEEEVEEGGKEAAEGRTAPRKRDAHRHVLNQLDGLRGLASTFAQRELEGDTLATSKAGTVVDRLVLPRPPPIADPQSQRQQRLWQEKREELERQFIAEHLDGVLRVFHCVGFERVPPPEVRPALTPLEDVNHGGRKLLAVNDRTGSFYPAGGDPAVVIGLFGAGSAFPESVAVGDGPRRPAVGIAAFGEFVRRMAPEWVEATRAGQMSGEEIKMLAQEQLWEKEARMDRMIREREKERGFKYY